MEVEIEKENRFRRETDKNEHRSIKCPECDEVIGRFNNKNMNAKNNLLPDSVALYVTKLQPDKYLEMNCKNIFMIQREIEKLEARISNIEKKLEEKGIDLRLTYKK
ncbi:MAG: hypothetical protein MHMPM18_003556 [Marteilia pararefringens]